MNKTELMAQIGELEAAADKLSEPDKTIALNKVATLKIRLNGMALDSINAIMQTMALPDIQDMKAKIAAANDATKSHQERVALFDKAVGIIKTGLNIAI